MKFKIHSDPNEDIRTGIVLGAGASRAESESCAKRQGPPMPLDIDAIAYLHLYGGHLENPDKAAELVSRAQEEFGSPYGTGLEALLARIEANAALTARICTARLGTITPGEEMEWVMTYVNSKLRPAALAICDLFNWCTSLVPLDTEPSQSLHLRLAQTLGPTDSVFSFNYDWLAEGALLLSSRWWHPLAGGFGAKLAWVPRCLSETLVGLRRPSKQRLFKLHGSSLFERTSSEAVNWLPRDSRVAANSDPIIVAPMLGKPVMFDLAIRPVWEKADEQVATVEALLVIGYLAPLADNLAQALLAKGRPLKVLITVNKDETNAGRVKSMLHRRISSETRILNYSDWGQMWDVIEETRNTADQPGISRDKPAADRRCALVLEHPGRKEMCQVLFGRLGPDDGSGSFLLHRGGAEGDSDFVYTETGKEWQFGIHGSQWQSANVRIRVSGAATNGGQTWPVDVTITPPSDEQDEEKSWSGQLWIYDEPG